jgi:dihydrofolate reductase
MSVTFADLGVSLDGYVAGPNAGPGKPLGDGGPRIHAWQYGARAFRERLGMSGGEATPDNALIEERFARTGAYVMGRRMFDEGEAGWPDPPPFRAPVLVLTHRPREPWERTGGTTFTFVTDGVGAAVEAARAGAAGKDVQVSGGADVVRQALEAGLIDELTLHVAPVLLGGGVRLFDALDPAGLRLEPDRVVAGPIATHLRLRVVR